MKQSEHPLSRGYVVALLAFVCCFLWGSAFPCIKVGYELFSIGSRDTAAQILFAGLRFTVAGLMVIAIGSLAQRHFLLPKRTSWGMVAKLSLAQTVVQYLLFYIGLANTSGVKGSIIEGSNVFFAILISALVFKFEKLTRNKLLGCLLGFAGVVLINLTGRGLDGGMKLTGEGFILLSCISYAMSSALVKAYGRKEDAVTLSGWQFLVGGLVMMAAGAGMGGRLHGFTAGSTLLLGYMALISAAAYSLWVLLLQHNPVGRVAVYGFLTPICGVVLSAVLLHEQNQAFTLRGLISLLLVCGGIYLGSADRERCSLLSQ